MKVCEPHNTSLCLWGIFKQSYIIAKTNFVSLKRNQVELWGIQIYVMFQQFYIYKLWNQKFYIKITTSQH